MNALLPFFLTGPHVTLCAESITDVTYFIGPVIAAKHAVMLTIADIKVALTLVVAGASDVV
jgi:hypothetical protein